MTLEGALDGDAFVAYLTAFLVPTLVAGAIMVMDNKCSVHKDKQGASADRGSGVPIDLLAERTRRT